MIISGYNTETTINVTTDFTLPWVDHSTLDAIERCPRLGIILYKHNKHMRDKRNVHLIAGSAMHRFFAAFNTFAKPELAALTFTAEELETFAAAAEASPDDKQQVAWALEALYTSEELPEDNEYKSVNELEKSCLYWAEMQNDNNREIVYVEHHFDLTINNTFRYVGKIDCIKKTKKRGILVPVEYKHTSRINDGYIAKWQLSRQVAGYYLALKVYEEEGKLPDLGISGEIADYIEVETIQVPIPKKITNLPHLRKPYEITEDQLMEWGRWIKRTYAFYEDETNAPWDAPTNQNACYSFNSVCQFLNEFCTQCSEVREEIFNEEMHEIIWNPTEGND